MSRQLVTVFSTSGAATGSVNLPAVFLSPLRPDVVQFVHTNINKNHRQAYSVNLNAGHQASAISWGTGRAVSRIPRVSGGGTQRSGQGAFGNMCRGGRMFAPTKTWRRWHRKVNTTQRRFAVASALAATAVPARVMARGHKIDQVPEVPLVLGGDVESVSKTSAVRALLASIGADADVDRAAESKKVRAGRGKMRGRRYTMRRGPLVVYATDDGIEKGFRNLPGVDLCNVERLNLLQLAPGGHMGRFVIYTDKAFAKLDVMYGANGKRIPSAEMTNADLARIINSDEIQSVVNPAKTGDAERWLRKKNATKSAKALKILSPYAAANRASETKAQKSRADAKAKKAKPAKKAKIAKKVKVAGKAFFEKIKEQGSVCANGFSAEM